MALDSSQADDAIKLLLDGATRLHVMHLKTRKHSTHVALDAAYKTFAELADTVAEQAIGAGWPVLEGQGEDNPVLVLQGYRRMIARSAEQTEDSALKNTLEEVLSRLDQLTYQASLT